MQILNLFFLWVWISRFRADVFALDEAPTDSSQMETLSTLPTPETEPSEKCNPRNWTATCFYRSLHPPHIRSVESGPGGRALETPPPPLTVESQILQKIPFQSKFILSKTEEPVLNWDFSQSNIFTNTCYIITHVSSGIDFRVYLTQEDMSAEVIFCRKIFRGKMPDTKPDYYTRDLPVYYFDRSTELFIFYPLPCSGHTAFGDYEKYCEENLKKKDAPEFAPVFKYNQQTKTIAHEDCQPLREMSCALLPKPDFSPYLFRFTPIVEFVRKTYHVEAVIFNFTLEPISLAQMDHNLEVANLFVKMDIRNCDEKTSVAQVMSHSMTTTTTAAISFTDSTTNALKLIDETEISSSLSITSKALEDKLFALGVKVAASFSKTDVKRWGSETDTATEHSRGVVTSVSHTTTIHVTKTITVQKLSCVHVVGSEAFYKNIETNYTAVMKLRAIHKESGERLGVIQGVFFMRDLMGGGDTMILDGYAGFDISGTIAGTVGMGTVIKTTPMEKGNCNCNGDFEGWNSTRY